ncbi:MAG TPA: helicase-exonuclease AddAB subunit AddB, partial [Candidatus Polarisedimenticolia bacterium]|nr:helicase-exonuclease AddAB subunit AddB [Candidatus Polarisedimenticolia bacterium]
MQIRFLLGPAGSGKTFRCLSEIRAALKAAPDGPPLILLAPKQATFQLERHLLADDSLAGYTRLRILSFEKLARFVFDQLRRPPPKMLDEEGRLMVLRALLSKKRDELKLFRASARLTGFAQQLSLVLRELQSHQITPEMLRNLARGTPDSSGLPLKLHDLALLLESYLAWLQEHGLQDVDCLIAAAATALKSQIANRKSQIEGLWLDGFVE